MALKSPKEKYEILSDLALKLNADMPRDIVLKGDGTFWMQSNNSDGVQLREATQEEVLKIIYTAIKYGNSMISV